MSKWAREATLRKNPKSYTILAMVLLLSSSLGLSHLVGNNESLAILILLGSAVFIFAFLNTDFAISILILSMLLSPEFSPGGSTDPIHGTHTGVVVRIDDLLLGLITLSWLAKVAINKELGVFIKTPMNRPIFAYIVASLFSTVLGIFSGNVKPLIGILYNVKYFQYFLIFFMATSHIKSMKTVRRYLTLLLLTALVVTIYATLQIPSGVRVSAPFEGKGGEANTLGGYLILIMFIVIGMMTGMKKNTHLATAGTFLMMMLVPFAFTLSRSSWLGFFPGLLTVIVLSEKRKVIITIVVIAAAMSPALIPEAVYERVQYTFSDENALRTDVVDLGNTALDPSTSLRIQSWTYTLEQWMERPVFGWGVTGAGFKDAQFFRVLAETGAVGFMLFLWMLYSIYRTARNALDKIDKKVFPVYHGLIIGFIGAYMGLIFHAVGANTFIIVRVMEPMWLVMSMIVMLPDLLEKEKSEVELDAFEKLMKSGKTGQK